MFHGIYAQKIVQLNTKGFKENQSTLRCSLKDAKVLKSSRSTKKG